MSKCQAPSPILVLGIADYNSANWTNVQHIASRLSLKRKIIYVNPPISLKRFLLDLIFKKKTQILNEHYINYLNLQNINNLYQITPIAVLPLRFNNIKIIETINYFFMYLQIRAFLNIKDVEPDKVFIFYPLFFPYLKYFSDKKIYYYCVDNYLSFPVNKNRKKLIEEYENNIIKLSKKNFTISYPLFERIKQKNKNTILIENACDFDFFQKQKSLSVLENIPSPIVGYIGALSDYKIDFNLLEIITRKLNNFNFVFIGKVGIGENQEKTLNKIKRIFNKDNIYLLEQTEYKMIPAYIEKFDICIIPYKINFNTKYCFPMKFFEYLALGKIVVSTDLPAIENYKDYYLSFDESEPKKTIEYAYEIKDKDIEKRKQLAKIHSYDNNINIIEKEIENE